jgi:hypothetical protein
MEQTATRRTSPPRRGRRLLRILAAIVVATGLCVVAAPSPASAAPAYYLYEENRNVVGPCGSPLSVGAYAGTIYYGSPYHYTNGPTSVWWEIDYQVWQYEERDFSSADYYHACSNYKYVYRYYGAAKVHRYVTTKYWCPPDLLTCLYAGTTYSSFTGGW